MIDVVTESASSPVVIRLGQLPLAGVQAMLRRWGLDLALVAAGDVIPASYWGDEEAGCIGRQLHARADTPVHSILHTAAHMICMDEGRRAVLFRDCGSDDIEESAVCYLQCLLAGELDGYSLDRLFADMDAWGYTFVAGSTRSWFETDAESDRQWLRRHGVLGVDDRPSYQLRDC